MTKIKVLCDTMIWYDVYDGTEVLDKTRFEYYGTGTNIGDFLSSDKMEGTDEQKEKLRNAILTMRNEASDVILIDPMTAGSSNLLGSTITDAEHKGFKDTYSALISFAEKKTIGVIGSGKDALIEQKNNFSKYTLDLRNQIDALAKKHENTEEEIDKNTEGVVADWLLQQFNQLYGLSYSMESINDWDDVIIFVRAYKKFLLSILPPVQANKNTMIDLLQLLYIRFNGPLLFWTKENKLLKKLRSEFTKEECNTFIYQEYLDAN